MRHRNAEFRENRLRLVFVDFHTGACGPTEPRLNSARICARKKRFSLLGTHEPGKARERYQNSSAFKQCELKIND
jgi:hypothetical protein